MDVPPSKQYAASREKAKALPAAPSAGKARPVKLSFRETRELDELPGKIEALEREQAEITTQLGDADLYREEPDKVKALHARYAAIESELMGALARWEALEAKQGEGR